MIILITGASHTGKTVLAQKLLEKYKIPYLSIDHLKMGLIRSGYTKLTPEEDTALSPDIPVGLQAPVQLPTSFFQVLLLFQTIAANSSPSEF